MALSINSSGPWRTWEVALIAYVHQAVVAAPAIGSDHRRDINCALDDGLHSLFLAARTISVYTCPPRLNKPRTRGLPPAPRLPRTRRGPKYDSTRARASRSSAGTEHNCCQRRRRYKQLSFTERLRKLGSRAKSKAGYAFFHLPPYSLMNRICLPFLGVWLCLTKATAQQPVQPTASPPPVGQVPATPPNPAPSPPIPVEFLAGNNRFGFQFTMNKAFTPSSRFSFLNVNTFTSDYSSRTDNLDLVIVAKVAYDLYKGFGPTAGLGVNSVGGLAPSAGIQYVFANKEMLFVISPSVEFSTTENLQGLVIGEYRPPLSQKINLFTRVQALYIHNSNDDFHLRSFLQLRVGLGIGHYQFGPAANLDYYGPEKTLKENYGAFIRYNFY